MSNIEGDTFEEVLEIKITHLNAIEHVVPTIFLTVELGILDIVLFPGQSNFDSLKEYETKLKYFTDWIAQCLNYLVCQHENRCCTRQNDVAVLVGDF